MARNIKQIITELISDTVAHLGYELVEVDYSKQAKDYLLTIFIDSEEGITLDDCEKVSRAVEPIIDEADPIPQAYCLCVSSLGLDRPLKTASDFKKAMNKCIDIKLYKNINGSKLVSGRLVDFVDEVITLEDADDKRIEISMKDAAKVTMHVDF